jgi:predicted lysophospholipase L1 biosynthesis ABC-type transport system permease subunit
MDQQKYLDDLKDIKDMMSRSSRFISLSGLSGVSAGIIALAGAFIAYRTVYADQDYLGYRQADLSGGNLTNLILIAVLTLALAIGFGIFFTTRKAKKDNQKLWDMQTKRLLINLLIPLATGGVLCLMLLFKGYIGFLAPLTLIFYGLALVNASKYTFHEVRSLGILEILLGLLAMQFIGYGLIFWSVGFGLLHIIYGIIMQVRYGS